MTAPRRCWCVPARLSIRCWGVRPRMLRLPRPRARKRLSAVLRARRPLAAATSISAISLSPPTNSPNFAVAFVAPAAQSILTRPRSALYWMRTEYPCRLSRVSVRVLRRLSRKPCCSPTSALQSGWQTVISRPAIACMRIRAPIACTVPPLRWRSSASSTIAVLPVLPWGVPMNYRLQLMLPPVRPTHRSSTRCFCAACSARCTNRVTRATLRSPRRATVTLRVPSVATPIWWCTACSNCSWHTNSWVEKTP